MVTSKPAKGKMQTVKSRASKAPIPMAEALSVIIKIYLESWQPSPAKLLFMKRRGRRPIAQTPWFKKGYGHCWKN